MDRRIPSLDGFRAISISLVVIHHLGLSELPLIWRFDVGNLGVRTFFVISGFLITSLLLKERERTGSISLGDFYLRRALRIMPAYWVFLCVMAIAVPWQDLLPSVLYYSNYHHPSILVGNTWSLAVEEQFYLLWPALLIVSGTKAPWVCVGMLILAPTMRTLSDHGLWPTESRYAWECVCDALAAGCLLALLREQLWSRVWYRKLVDWAPWIGAAGLLVFGVGGGAVLLNLAIAVVLDRYMRNPQVPVGRFLNWTPVVWLGTLSYSLYLWQQPFMFGMHLPRYFMVMGGLVTAVASLYLIERPFQGVRKRFRRNEVTSSLVRYGA